MKVSGHLHILFSSSPGKRSQYQSVRRQDEPYICCDWTRTFEAWKTVKHRDNSTLLYICGSNVSSFIIVWHVSQLLGCAAGVAQQNAARQRPLNNWRQNTHCAAVRGGGVFSAQQRWRHTAARSLPGQRCCKHGDATQPSPLVRLRVYKRSS
jgi:hypothetical protein